MITGSTGNEVKHARTSAGATYRSFAMAAQGSSRATRGFGTAPAEAKKAITVQASVREFDKDILRIVGK